MGKGAGGQGAGSRHGTMVELVPASHWQALQGNPAPARAKIKPQEGIYALALVGEVQEELKLHQALTLSTFCSVHLCTPIPWCRPLYVLHYGVP